MTWYHRLLGEKGLLQALGNNRTSQGIVVQVQFRGQRLFNYFPNVYNLQDYLGKLPQEQRCMYEIIFGEDKQKPHFDLDIPRKDCPNGDVVLEELLQQIIIILHSLRIIVDPTRDILIFTSHGLEKWSYHVVLDNYHHENNLQAKQFFHMVTKNMKCAQFVDDAVYSGKQNFRILGCQKEGSGRIKTWLRKFYISGILYQQREDSQIFRRSLVSQLSDNSRIIPITVIPKLIIEQTISNSETRDVEILIAKYCPESNIREIKGNVFELTRRESSFCKVCQRNHDNENPYVVYQPETGALFKFCRRNNRPDILTYVLRDLDIKTLSFSKDLPDKLRKVLPKRSRRSKK